MKHNRIYMISMGLATMLFSIFISEDQVHDIYQGAVPDN
jgi:hypothetical protein